MRKRRRNMKFKLDSKFRSFLSLTLVILACFCSGVAYKNNNNAIIDTISQYISKVSNTNINSKTFLSFAADGSYVNGIYSRTYGQNFSNYYSQIISYTNKQKEFLSFEMSCNNACFNDVKICDTFAYSNLSDLKRFETININLYKTPNRVEEINTFGLDGFIYLPDFIADTILEENPEINSYGDLVPNLSGMSDNDRERFLEKYSVTIRGENEELIGRFKIANIFHVKGFNDEQYIYNDMGAGKIFYDFFGQYVILSSSKIRNYEKCIVSCFDSKRFIIEQEINKYKDLLLSDECSLAFYLKNNENRYLTSLVVTKDTLQNGDTLSSYIFYSIGAIFLITSLFVACRSFVKERSKKLYFVVLSLLLLFELIMQLLYLVIFRSNYYYISLYNMMFNVPVLVYFVFLIVVFVKRIKDENKCK